MVSNCFFVLILVSNSLFALLFLKCHWYLPFKADCGWALISPVTSLAVAQGSLGLYPLYFTLEKRWGIAVKLFQLLFLYPRLVHAELTTGDKSFIKQILEYETQAILTMSL